MWPFAGRGLRRVDLTGEKDSVRPMSKFVAVSGLYGGIASAERVEGAHRVGRITGRLGQ